MAKTVVTHVSPDLDGILSIWLLRKFHPDFFDSQLAFVPAGSTYKNQPVDSNGDIVHVDTGMGKFDHHQSADFTCAAQLVYEWLVQEGYVAAGDEALARMTKIITELDHGWDNYKWCEAENDRYEFCLHNLLVGWKVLYPGQDQHHIDLATAGLEAVYKLLQFKVRAEKEIDQGRKFTTRWGEGVAVTSENQTILDLAIKKGFAVALTRNPKKGNVRVTGSNNLGVDLTGAYEVLRQKDPQATWFLHASKVLLRNGSSRNPQMVATKLTLEEVVEILEKA